MPVGYNVTKSAGTGNPACFTGKPSATAADHRYSGASDDDVSLATNNVRVVFLRQPTLTKSDQHRSALVRVVLAPASLDEATNAHSFQDAWHAKKRSRGECRA
jgi:hypothetical protein